MLVELSVMEQRYHAVMEVVSGAPVTEVARRYGVTRQVVHLWHRRARRADYHGAAYQHWRDQPVQGLRQTGNHRDPCSSNHTRYREAATS
jgi:transposase-like protein